MQELFDFLFIIFESPIPFTSCLSDFVAFFSLSDCVGEVYFCNEIKFESNGCSSMSVDCSELLWSDFVVVKLIDDLFKRESSYVVNEFRSDFFLFKDSL